MRMPSSIIRLRSCYAMAVMLAALLLTTSAAAQPSRAEAIFAAARSLAAAQRYEATGVSTGDANGREVESLGMLAQKKGAKAVLATLWKVADESTSLFMAEFYRIKKANPAMNKAEAIRLAQKEMIDGRIKASGTSNGCRAETFGGTAKKDEFKCDPNAPFSHPYFWSPFVLIGNWR